MNDQFLANFIHELRTLISGVFASTNLLAKSLRGRPDAIDLVKVIRLNNRRILDLINNALDLSKIEAGRMTIERTRCDPGQLAAEIVSLMRPSAAEKGLTLDAENRGEIPRTVTTDPLRLRQVLVNLMDNAVKFTDLGGVRLMLELTGEAAGEPRLLFHVIDTGVGMSAEHQRRVFEPFVQAETSTARRYGGTGLGLAISGQLARLLGGELALCSETDRGSVFTLSLPTGPLEGIARIDHLPQLILEPVRRSARPVRQLRSFRLEGLDVLLIEDRPSKQLLFAATLKSAGAAVHLVRGGGEAADYLDAAVRADRPPDAAVLGLHPRDSGERAVWRLREAGYRGPIIAIAAGTRSEDPELPSGGDCTEYLTEPVDTPALTAAVIRGVRTATAGNPDCAGA